MLPPRHAFEYEPNMFQPSKITENLCTDEGEGELGAVDTEEDDASFFFWDYV